MSKKVDEPKPLSLAEVPNRPTYFMGRHDELVRKMMGRYGFLRVNNIKSARYVVFTGGPDVSPFLYGEPRHKKSYIHFAADLVDIQTLRAARHDQIKIGICRGAQFLNVMIGNGRLYQHVDGHARGFHLAAEPGPNGALFQVSSTHHQMMIPGTTGIPLLSASVSSTRETGLGTETVVNNNNDDPEAVLYMDDNTFCFQPHPEFPNKENEKCRDWFFDQIETYFMKTTETEACKIARSMHK